MKTFFLTLSREFPQFHPKSGKPTLFFLNLLTKKLHTIRDNFDLWNKRFEKIEKGDYCLSIRLWTGKPYRSKQPELFFLDSTDKIGLQRVRIFKHDGFSARIIEDDGSERVIDVRQLAHNDGLSVSDWCDWFSACDLSQDFALIHFTKFRY